MRSSAEVATNAPAAAHVPWGAPPQGYSGPRRSLILSGGGIRLSYQAGVLRALSETDLCFAHCDATSGGAINLAMLLSGLSPAEMGERWRTLKLKDTLGLMPLKKYLNQRDAVAMGSADGFVRRAFPHLGIHIERVNAAQGMQGTFNVFNYSRKVNEVIPHQRLDMDFLVAGMSLPGVMPPVRKNGTLYLDSAFVRDANLMEAVRRGAEELWLVWALGNTNVYRGGPLHIYVQMLEMAANGSLVREFEEIEQLNERIRRGDSPYGQTRAIRLHLVRPETPLPLDPDLYLGKIDAARLIEMGYTDARRYLAARTEAGLPFTPETIMMSNATEGVTFRETMQGNFALGETDPRAGAEKGKRENTTLAMHANITVEEMDRFISDPEHTARLMASVDFTPFGTGIPAREGKFNLFSPGGDPNRREMVYEFPFEHQGEQYYLHGFKDVHDDPGFDTWSDLTTLFTRLHRGSDRSGEVVGAGVLTISMPAFLKVLGTVRATGSDSKTDQARTLAKFGKFFAGKVWDSYAPKL
ncbi:hypothetical protein BH23GEM7_BH23GEM7_06600 [soil metagenome]